MGFPKHRAEKALAATGHRGVQLASDWLLAHVNDPTLDQEDCPREYVVYLCPVGPLSHLIHAFWDDSLRKCGWNGAHNLVPHITLCSFFKSLDENCEALVSILKDVVHTVMPSLPPNLTLDKYISPNYMGLFLNDQQADVLKKLALAFVKEVSPMCCTSEAASKALHLTLAYQFQPSQYPRLESLADNVDFQPSQYPRLESLADNVDVRVPAAWKFAFIPETPGFWDVHKVLYSHVPRDPDELELHIGDFVYVRGGGEGLGVGAGVEATPPPPLRHPTLSLSLLNLLESSEGSRRSTTEEVVSEASSSTPVIHHHHQHSRQASIEAATSATQSTPMSRQEELDSLYAKVKKPKKEGPLYHFPIEGGRRIIVARHGERVDFTFGDWIRYCFDEGGNYERRDLNMPDTLPERVNAPNSFYKDCPLTNVGLLQATLLGLAMRDTDTHVHHVYCSPSLRCVQTCTNILKGLGISEHMPLNMEPGLFEWLAWYHEGMPTWMTADELTTAGYNINHRYDPLIRTDELLDTRESCEQYYARNAYVTQSIINNTQAQGGSVLLVGHAATLDTCTRQLVGGAPRSAQEMTTLIKKIPYCSFAFAGQDTTGSWSLQEPPFPPVTHSGNMRYDWRSMTNT
ncbi:hypothetical protein Pmani_038884 [Petrolisthes manimaculis]|uniref:Ecdysteroid-phosphate phosphatase n=1 Tax=Petrolisthes manimaculis TaxID=1843537 RepID=A0AAE1TJU1_9EUCA|nr:hypothetical protein Pmani_038884 [Petrolisthes manimaculis]KAK4288063.1 hypothetical protein Pmani_038884 [Petrolisthes manimaculis]KAK4288064.1 hypothetical protein Pmani_038884 [Petrolisthes manimaculis]KAK4288065.1 hypothetical protein Pmani_038884 [Petrolisthes manimaculis]